MRSDTMFARATRTFSLLIAVFGALLAAPAAHAADAPFTPRFAKTLHGSIQAVGNTLMTCPTAAANCTAARARTATGGALNNNSYTMGFVDVDGDPSTASSSSADVALPAGAQVVWAGLFWAADTSAGTNGVAAPSPAAIGTVRLKVPGGGYQAVSAAPADVLTSTSWATRYRAFADVTARVPATGSGTYTVAGVQAGTGQDRFAGWALIVAYRHPAQPMHRVQVYDGLGTVDATHTYATNVAPFFTPATGPVASSFGMLAFEGDPSLIGETATLDGWSWSDALNTSDNFMNSTIESGGAYVTAKNPNYANQLGMDLDAFSRTGLLANGQSSTTMTFTSNVDYFMPSAFWLVSDEGPPVTTSGPAVSGTPRDGGTLTATPGTWNGTPVITPSYQWQRCDAHGAHCADIPGATGPTYTTTPADVGATIRVVAVGHNDAGASAPAASPPTAVVTATPPVLSGPAQPGGTLVAGPATPPAGTSYQWQRCGPAGCVDIPGATSSRYTITPDDAGQGVRVVVTVTNGAGRTSTASAATAVPGYGCQQLARGAKYLRERVAGIGNVRVRAYTSGPALDASPLRISTTVHRGRATSVRYMFDGRPLAAGRAPRWTAVVTPQRLGPVGVHELVTTLRGAGGTTQTRTLRLRTVPCRLLFTAQRWRTNAGAGLRLRVDSRQTLQRLSFAVPAALLPRQTGRARAVGFLRYWVAGRSAPRRIALHLPGAGQRAVLLARAAWPAVRYGRGGIRVDSLPAGARVAELTLYRATRVDGATPGRTFVLRAHVVRAGAQAKSFTRHPAAPR